MNTLKFILVIVLPEVATFGWLILASFAFVVIGAIFYNCYAFANRQKPRAADTEYLDVTGS
jgi:hypothetical protein